LSGRAWEKQMPVLVDAGYAHQVNRELLDFLGKASRLKTA
jgi:hypothetical protein